MNYVDIPFVDERLNPRPIVGQRWGMLSPEVKSQYIVWSEQLIDRQYYLGTRVDPNIENAFPRRLMEYVEKTEIWEDASDECRQLFQLDDRRIPNRIRLAVCEVIAQYFERLDYQDFEQMQKSNMSNFSKAGMSTTFNERTWFQELPEQAFDLISYLTTSGWYSDYPKIARA